VNNKTESNIEDAQSSSIRVGFFGRLIDARLGRLAAASRCPVRASYELLYTRRVFVGAKQRLTNQCREGTLGHLSFAAHDRYRLRSARRGVAVFRARATNQMPPQRRLSTGSTISAGSREQERGLFRGYNGPSRPSAPNQRAMYIMADWKIGHSHGRSEAQSVRDVRANRNHRTTNQSSLRNHVNELPISRRSTAPLSARSVNQRYAVIPEQPTCSATSLVPATPPHSRRASRKSLSDHEAVYRPVSSSRLGGTDRVLMPLSYGAYGIIALLLNTTAKLIPLLSVPQGTKPRSLGTRWRVRVNGPPGPGFAPNKPMNLYGSSRLESAGFCALSSATTIRRASASDGRQPGPQQDARDHRGEVA
jgi:hypothetical protein